MRIHGILLRSLPAFALALSFASPSAAQQANIEASSATANSATANSATAVVDVSRVRIDNFGRVSPTYYRGAQPMGRDYADLAALGVKTVINLTSHDAQRDERALVEQAGMKYVQIPMTTRKVPTSDQLAQFLGVVNDPASGPVFVHCVGGKHRTGVMTAAHRMTNSAWTAEQAFREMKSYKFGADFLHPEFKKFVYSFRPAPQPADPANTTLVENATN